MFSSVLEVFQKIILTGGGKCPSVRFPNPLAFRSQAGTLSRDSRSLKRNGVPCKEKRLLWQESERCCSPGESHCVPRGGVGVLAIKMWTMMTTMIMNWGRFCEFLCFLDEAACSGSLIHYPVHCSADQHTKIIQSLFFPDKSRARGKTLLVKEAPSIKMSFSLLPAGSQTD